MDERIEKYPNTYDLAFQMCKVLGIEPSCFDSKYTMAYKILDKVKEMKQINPDIHYEFEGIPTVKQNVSSSGGRISFVYTIKTFRGGLLIKTESFNGHITVAKNSTKNWKYFDEPFVDAVGGMHYIRIEQQPSDGYYWPDY